MIRALRAVGSALPDRRTEAIGHLCILVLRWWLRLDVLWWRLLVSAPVSDRERTAGGQWRELTFLLGEESDVVHLDWHRPIAHHLMREKRLLCVCTALDLTALGALQLEDVRKGWHSPDVCGSPLGCDGNDGLGRDCRRGGRGCRLWDLTGGLGGDGGP